MLVVALWVAGGVFLAGLAAAFVFAGPRNVIGMIRYGHTRGGRLRTGDRAPDVALVSLDGASGVRLLAPDAGRPRVLVFGSYT